MAASAHAQDLNTRVEANVRYGDDRSIYMSEFWMPLAQTETSVLYGDLRLMSDDAESDEGNLGVGYRFMTDAPLLGKGILGLNGWIDRRNSPNNNVFYQTTLGAEWLGDVFDLRSNAYIGLSDAEKTIIPGSVTGSFFSGSGVFLSQIPGRQSIEEIQDGIDAEIGFTIPILQTYTDSIRFYTGGYYFDGDHSKSITGWSSRLAVDITSDFRIGARIQRDAERGSQGFLEATIRFPFKNKQSYRDKGLAARLDESPERDIDIITSASEISSGPTIVPVTNTTSGTAQRVIHVDNSLGAAGNGSYETPFNTLAAAQAALQDNDIMYVRAGTGTTVNQNAGINLSRQNVRMIGSGIDFYYDGNQFSTTGNGTTNSFRLAAATTAPVITNNNANGDGITISADNVSITGVRVANANRDGIAVLANGVGTSALNAQISDVRATGNRNGVMVYGSDGGAVGASIQKTVVTGNTQHGVAVYDDTNGAFSVDLGGGGTSAGLNSFTGNTMEDLAVDYDGGTLIANNNWWGQAGGPLASQVYLGAPLEDSMVAHWKLDENAGVTAADRIAAHNGTLVNGAAWAPAGGQFGGAIDLTKTSSQYITIPDFNAADTGNKLTVSYWINPDSVSTKDTHIGKWDEANGFESSWGTRATNGISDEIFVFIGDNNDPGDNFFQTSNLDLAPGAWANITFVYDGAGATNADRLKVYKNGVQVAGNFNGTIPTVLNNTNLPISFGRRLTNDPAFASYADGRFDDVRIYNSSLTAGKVGEIARSTSNSALQSTGSLSAAP